MALHRVLSDKGASNWGSSRHPGAKVRRIGESFQPTRLKGALNWRVSAEFAAAAPIRHTISGKNAWLPTIFRTLIRKRRCVPQFDAPLFFGGVWSPQSDTP